MPASRDGQRTRQPTTSTSSSATCSPTSSTAAGPIYAGTAPAPCPPSRAADVEEPVVITGAALGTPGTARIFDDANLGRLLNGEQFIDVIPTRIRNEMLEHRITRLVKSDQGASFETIDSPSDVLKLAARGGEFDLAAEFGVDADRVAAYGRTTQLAIGAGFDALRDAGIPLVMRYKTTHLGTQLPERWGLPDELRDDTGVIFASAFPGIEEFAKEAHAFAADQTRREERAELEAIRARLVEVDGADVALDEIDRRLHDLGKFIDDEPVPLRPPLPAPCPVDGALPVRRPDRRPWPEHADQLGVRQHDPGRSPRRGLDPRRPLPSRRRDRGRRRHLRRPPRLVRFRLPRDRRSRHRRRRDRGGHPVRPPAPRDDPRHGRRGARGRIAPTRLANAACSRSARCSAPRPPTAPSTAPGSTSTTSAT